MANYVISNGATSSGRVADIDITRDATNLKTQLQSMSLVLEAQQPNVWRTSLNYTTKENNQIKYYSDVISTITDTLAVDIVTASWTLKFDYTAASVNPDLVLQVNDESLTPHRIELVLDKASVRPLLKLDFLL